VITAGRFWVFTEDCLHNNFHDAAFQVGRHWSIQPCPQHRQQRLGGLKLRGPISSRKRASRCLDVGRQISRLLINLIQLLIQCYVVDPPTPV